MINHRFKQALLRLLQVISVGIVLLVGVSCNSFRNSPQKQSLYDSGWVLERANNGKEALPRSPVFLAFRRERVWGFTGCNWLEAQMGSTTIDDHTLKLGLAITEIGCEDSKFEFEYRGFIGRAVSYQTNGITLSLFDESGQLLLTYRRDDKYLTPPPTATSSNSIPCNQPRSNC